MIHRQRSQDMLPSQRLRIHSPKPLLVKKISISNQPIGEKRLNKGMICLKKKPSKNSLISTTENEKQTLIQFYAILRKNHRDKKILYRQEYFKSADKFKQKIPVFVTSKSCKQTKTQAVDFEILKKLGAGTNTQVYLVRHKETGIICAMKIYEKTDSIYQQRLRSLRRQLKFYQKIKHPNIIQLWGSFQDLYYVYLIFEPCLNGNLYQYLQKRQKINVEETSKYIGQICSAVDYLHDLGIIHRDIKPENILINQDSIKLADFGQSVLCHQGQYRNTFCGTPLYLCPEIIDRKQYNSSADIWAIGILTYQLLTGRIPFDIETRNDLGKIITDDVDYDRIASIQARDFLQKLLQKSPKDRKSIKQIMEHPFVKIGYFR